MDLENSPNVLVGNRFSILSSFASNSNKPVSTDYPPRGRLGNSGENLPANYQNSAGTGPNGRVVSKPPPFYVQNFDGDVVKLSRSLEEEYDKNFNLKLLGFRVRIQMFSVEDFIKLKESLLSGNTAFHTYTLNSQKVLTVVLKALSNIPPEEIINELKEKGLQSIYCSILNSSSTKKPMYPSYKVVFSHGTTLGAVNKVGFIFHTRVYWEKFLSQRTYTQCYRCQAFGHASTNCNYPPKCVKCAGPHPTRECTKAREVAPVCVNCAGTHTANYSKCPALEKYMQSRSKPAVMTLPIQVAPLDLNNNKSYPGLQKQVLRSQPLQAWRTPLYKDVLTENTHGTMNHSPSQPHGGNSDAILDTLLACNEIDRLCDVDGL